MPQRPENTPLTVFIGMFLVVSRAVYTDTRSLRLTANLILSLYHH